jgi:catechol 2,3-dioxygenase-like lactoylglutathione lyase family enzyme
MMKVKGLSHVQINVSDMERSLHFYRDALGLVERMRTGPYILLSSPEGGDFVSLSQLEPVGAPGLGHFGLHLEAEDIRTAIRTLEDAGGKLVSGDEYSNFPSANRRSGRLYCRDTSEADFRWWQRVIVFGRSAHPARI